ncbi:uncharacterized protein LOC119092386 [Pollicipes pollicipes]|uniref:uncharacterized protein LOC119092386 n=1 Tax=Pollicipes pollicipes TaxID=41117 RepID=UPI0018854DFE|nr:uncharacterized protein LOC119092386 [Pollicipes pollicipes]
MDVLRPQLQWNFRKYRPDTDPDERALQMVQQLAAGPPGDERAQLRAALLLLSALRGSAWTNDCPLERAVVPLLARWRDGQASEEAAAACLRLTGELTALYPERTDRAVEEAVCILEGVALHKEPAPAPVRQAARAAVLLLRDRVPPESNGRLLRCLEALPPADGRGDICGGNGETAVAAAD